MKMHVLKKGKKTYCGLTHENSCGTGHFPVLYPQQIKLKYAYINVCHKCEGARKKELKSLKK